MNKSNLLFIAFVILVTVLTFMAGKEPTLTGRATDPLLTETEEIEDFGVYAFNPSFKYAIESDSFSTLLEIETRANQTRDDIIDCLKKGSNRNDDNNDIKTCKNINPNKNIIVDVEDKDNEFYIFFDVEGVKFCLHLQDNIPPPKTENIRTVTEDTKTNLEWDKNKASDLAGYDLYYIGKGVVYVDLSDLTLFESDFLDEKIEITTLDYANLDFFVIAKDEAGNYRTSLT